jgi:S-adenosylmethionine decarboxylase
MDLLAESGEWVVDAYGCDPRALRSQETLADLFETIVAELELTAPLPPLFHVFPGEGGITGFLLLTESHLTCHSFPETGFAAFNLYCCRPHRPWPWAERLGKAIGATRVVVRTIERGRPAAQSPSR